MGTRKQCTSLYRKKVTYKLSWKEIRNDKMGGIVSAKQIQRNEFSVPEVSQRNLKYDTLDRKGEVIPDGRNGSEEKHNIKQPKKQKKTPHLVGAVW